MTTLDDIRDSIISRLQSVQEIGRVHNHQPYIRREKELLDLYLYKGQIRGWHVRRIGTHETSPSAGRWVETHRWLIHGFMSLDGASELIFDGLIEEIRAAFRADETLSGQVAATITEDLAGIQVEDCLPVMFCGVLCHSARLTLNTVNYR